MTRNGASDVSGSWKRAGPEMPAPSYESIDSQPLNKAIMSLFRRKMVDAIGTDSNNKGCGDVTSEAAEHSPSEAMSKVHCQPWRELEWLEAPIRDLCLCTQV